MGAETTTKNQIPQVLIYTFMLLMIVTGSINTIANKLQNITKSLELPYKHEWFITFCMFLGESLCLIMYYFDVYFIKKKKNNFNTVNEIKLLSEESRIHGNETITKDELKKGKTNLLPTASPFQLMLPAACDFIGTTIMTFGLSMIAGSIYQMLRGSLIIFTAIFSIIFLKSKIYRHNYLGIFSVILGLVLVGVAAFNKEPNPECGSDDSSNVVLGFCLVIFAQIFSATQFILEENFMKKYDCPPLKAVGWEGIWGSIFYIIFLIIAQNIECTLPADEKDKSFAALICSKNDKNVYYLEDTLFALKQLGNNGNLLFYCILYICSIGFFNFVGITISKVLSSPARAVLDTIRTIIVWLFFLFPIVDECHRETFQVLQLIGFIFLILGTVIYNEILPIPFLEFDKYLQKNLDKEKGNETNDDNDV